MLVFVTTASAYYYPPTGNVPPGPPPNYNQIDTTYFLGTPVIPVPPPDSGGTYVYYDQGIWTVANHIYSKGNSLEQFHGSILARMEQPPQLGINVYISDFEMWGDTAANRCLQQNDRWGWVQWGDSLYEIWWDVTTKEYKPNKSAADLTDFMTVHIIGVAIDFNIWSSGHQDPFGPDQVYAGAAMTRLVDIPGYSDTFFGISDPYQSQAGSDPGGDPNVTIFTPKILVGESYNGLGVIQASDSYLCDPGYGSRYAGAFAYEGNGIQFSTNGVESENQYPNVFPLDDSTTTLCAGDTLCYQLIASDPDVGDTVTLELLEGPISYTTTTAPTIITEDICFLADTTGLYRFVWRVTDRLGLVKVDTVDFNVTRNCPPRLTIYGDTVVYLCDTTEICIALFGEDDDDDDIILTKIVGPGGLGQYSDDDNDGDIDTTHCFIPDTSGTYCFVFELDDDGMNLGIIEDDDDVDSICVTVIYNDPVACQTCTPSLTLSLVLTDENNCPVGTLASTECFLPTSSFVDFTIIGENTPWAGNNWLAWNQSGTQNLNVILNPSDASGATSSVAVIGNFGLNLLNDVDLGMGVTNGTYDTPADAWLFSQQSLSLPDPPNGAYQWFVVYDVSGQGFQTYRWWDGDGQMNSFSGDYDLLVFVDDDHTAPNFDYDDFMVGISGAEPAICVGCQLTILCPSDTTISCDTSLDPSNTGTATASGTCTGVTVTYSDVSVAGACTNESVITRMWIATDDASNADTCYQTITVQDTTKPVLAGCPTDATVSCDAIPAVATVTATDNCDASPVVTFAESETAGACANSKTITRTWTATDACGNVASCSQVITVQDTTKPVLAGCPTDTTVSCDAIPAAATVTATDNCDTSPVVTFAESETAGACANAKTITRTWTATDDCGNVATCSQTITVEDNTIPVLAGCPADVTVECDAIPAAAAVTATDNCDSSVTVVLTESEVAGACANSKTITRTWTATDACGNSSECVQVINVSDNAAPIFDQACPADAIVSCDNIPDPPTMTATDNCDANPTVIFTESSVAGSCPQESIITRSWTVTDDCGNSNECVQILTVEDNTDPVCTVPADTTLYMCDASQICLPVGATDNCDPNPAITIMSGPGAIINGEWCYTPSGNETVAVTIKFMDACYNAVTSTFNVTFEVNNAPVCEVPADQTIFQCTPTQVCLPVSCTDVDGNLSAGSPAIVSGPGAIVNGEWCYTPSGAEAVTVVVSCTDDCGATSQCSFTITFEMNSAPVCSVPNDQTIEQCDPALVSLPVGCTDADGNLSAGSPSITSGPGLIVNGNWEYTPTGDEIVTVEITCTDDCGASSVCSFTITFEINEAPVCSAPADQTINQCEPAQVCLPVGCSDADGNLLANQPIIISGPGAIVNGEWCYTPTGPEIATVTLQCEDACGAICQSTFEIIFDVNSAPVCSVPDDQSIFQCAPTQVCLPVGCTDVDGNLLANQPTIISGPGAIVNGEWCYTPAGDETATVTVQCEDDCGLVCQSTFVITFEINEKPVCQVPNDTTIILCEPTEICLPVSCTDADGNLAAGTPTVKFGPGAVVNGEWCYTAQSTETAVVTIECVDECGAVSQCTFSVDFVVNSAPAIVQCPADINVHWGAFISETVTATDADGDGSITFSLGGGSVGAINATSGVFTWNTSGSSVCGGDAIVIATDDCGLADTCQFNICVYNDPPTLASSDPAQVCWGSTLTGQASGFDPDGGPINLFYSVLSFDGPGTVVIDGATGEYSWETSQSAEFAGTFELCIEVTDNANVCEPCSPTNADTSCVLLTVVPAYQVHIEKTHGTLQGHYVDVAVYLDSSMTYLEMGGFDFLIAYDASALTFAGAAQGQMLADCGWEYFTYRYGAEGNCGSGCPSGEIRLVGIAETNNGDNHPICRTNDGVSSVLANLTFLVSNDRTLECNYVPIRFHWYECADNTISSPGGDTLYLASAVYDYRPLEGQGEFQDITNTTALFPSYTGAHYTCDDGSNEAAKSEPLRCLEFYNGGVDIICADSIDARGDINLDGLSYTISDAVMYINYFINGLQAFTDVADTNSYGFVSGYEGSVAASDVNADGLTLTVSDMVYLIRVIVGDALPYPKVTPLEIGLSHDDDILSVDHDMGAAYILVRGIETPVLIADNLDMKFSHENGNTRIIIFSLSTESFTGEFVAVSGELMAIEMATYDGQPTVTKLVPTEFKLDQNYPNPFNPTTVISFQLPTASQTKLDIYNVQGQRVATLVDGFIEAGPHQFLWESAGASSGVYFYRLETADITETRKMILLK